MTDLHTHILPGIDDGAATVEDSLAMLELQRSQGVDTVVLTPHFYSNREEIDGFLLRRGQAMDQLKSAIAARKKEQTPLPRLLLGAEVAWHSGLMEMERLDELCIAGTRNLLLELPFTPWKTAMIDQLYNMIGCTGITPIIAHLERYIRIQPKSLVREVLEMGVPVQVSADILLRPLMRREAIRLLKNGQAHLVASDCHDRTRRGPVLAAAMEVVEKKLGGHCVRELCGCADALVRA